MNEKEIKINRKFAGPLVQGVTDNQLYILIPDSRLQGSPDLRILVSEIRRSGDSEIRRSENPGPLSPNDPFCFQRIEGARLGGLLAGLRDPELYFLKRAVPHPKIAYFPDPTKSGSKWSRHRFLTDLCPFWGAF